jgi:XTP/dITP diphosphohydrolase
MTELVFATNNTNKRDEVAQMLADQYRIKTLAELGVTEDIPEDAPDLTGNAQLKARYVYERYGVNVFADDTGLEVHALNGAPGVHSARFAGEERDNAANIRKLLSALENASDRSAQFRTVICLILNGEEYLFEGKVEGEIITELKGDAGFGYDPVFRPTGRMETFAEMTKGDKNAISHRGRAISKLIDFLGDFGRRDFGRRDFRL